MPLVSRAVADNSGYLTEDQRGERILDAIVINSGAEDCHNPLGRTSFQLS